MTDFLPDDYEIPQTGGQYMKFKQGDNRFRILDKPITGSEYWVTSGKGRKPVRKRKGEQIMVQDIEEGERLTHFWAMPVFNYAENRVQVLEITQKGIQNSILGLAKDADWGSPTGYDIVVNRQGESLETQYTVQPKPAKAITDDITKAFEEVKKAGFNIEALFDGGDPFTGLAVAPEQKQTGIEASEEINIDDIPF